MILQSIRLVNFRQFYGDNKVFFSTDKKKNVTVFYGENGSGKTTLLNAFCWCMYGSVSDKFEKPESITNERAIAEIEEGGEIETRVDLEFEHDEKTFFISRMMLCRKISDKGSQNLSADFDLKYKDIDGKTVNPNNPKEYIKRILPEALFPSFFFDGERIEKLAQPKSSKEIQKAIKNIMGIEIVERSINHTKSVRKILTNELEKIGEPETKSLSEQVIKLVDEIEANEGKIIEIKSDKEKLDEEINIIFEKLRSLEATKELQRRRDELEADLKDVEVKIKSVKNNLQACCSKFGYVAFAAKLAINANTLLDDKRKKGEIPRGIKNQFVDDLLERGLCICGRKLVKGELPCIEVEKWKDTGESDAIERTITRVTSDLAMLNEKRKEIYKDILTLVKQREELEHRITMDREELSQISSEIKDKDTEDIRRLEDKIIQLRRETSDIDQEIGRLNEQITIKKAKEKNILDEIKKQQFKSEKARVANKRLDLCVQAYEVLEKIYGILINRVRKLLSEKIRDVFVAIKRKDFSIELTEDYTIEVKKKVGDRTQLVAKSTGENQVTSLSFIGALVALAMEQYKKEKSIFFRGGVYPIIMDAPFGVLDDEYREKISSSIPNLSPQVILMVTKQQWKGQVESFMRNRVGKEYVITYNKPGGKVEEDYIKLDGGKYPLIKKSDSRYEKSEFLEVN